MVDKSTSNSFLPAGIADLPSMTMATIGGAVGGYFFREKLRSMLGNKLGRKILQAAGVAGKDTYMGQLDNESVVGALVVWVVAKFIGGAAGQALQGLVLGFVLGEAMG